MCIIETTNDAHIYQFTIKRRRNMLNLKKESRKQIKTKPSQKSE